MADLDGIDPNATLLRVRQLVNKEGSEFLVNLSREELMDMILCACSSLGSMRVLGGVTAKAVDALVNTEVGPK